MIKESEAQGEALRAYKLLTNTFPMREDCSWIYPEEYGGAYIDDNNSLVIALVDRTAELEAEYKMCIRDRCCRAHLQTGPAQKELPAAAPTFRQDPCPDHFV